MKKLLLVFFFVCSTNLFAQYIDNIVLLNNSTPPSLHIYGSYGSTGVSITSITHEISDTFKIKLFFKACAGLTVIVPFDTIITFNNNWPAAPTHLQALSILDTTTDLNCGPVTIFDTLFTYNATWLSLNVANHNTTPEISIYPNPTSNFITIEIADTEQILAIELLDYAGKHIKSIDPKTTYVDLSNLTTGIYLLQITTTQGKYCEQIRLE